MLSLVVMLAGPNGAGNSRFYEAYLSGLGLPFLNADILAKGVGLGAYEAAGQIAAMRDELVRLRRGSITETVLSDPVGAKVEWLRQTSTQGFDVRLIFIGIESAAMSADRVAARVAAGGHDVPLDKLRDRYDRTLVNLGRAVCVLPSVRLHDNSSFDHPHRFIAGFRNGELVGKSWGPIPRWARAFVR